MRPLSILAAIAVTAIASAAPAHAENWWIIDMGGKSGTVLEADSMVILPSGNRRVWVAIIHPKPMTDLPISDVSVLRTLFELDCKDGRFRSLQTGFMTKTLENRHQSHAPSEWSYVAPGTMGASMFDVTCRGNESAKIGKSIRDLATAVDVYHYYLSKTQ